MKKVWYLCLYSFVIVSSIFSKSRSPHRPKKPSLPRLSVCWEGESQKYYHSDSHFKEYPIFHVCNMNYLNKHLLPSTPISFKNNPDQHVDGTIISNLVEELLNEIKAGKKQYKHFTVLQRKNFTLRKQCGLLVLKFNDYPFVLKLFMENPKTFLNQHCKGFENIWFFYMSGGVNRHVVGFTRLKNREHIIHELTKLPRWANRVYMPRKWFWLPKENNMLHIEGQNIGTHKTIETKMPGTYAIIADAIDFQQEAPLPQKEKNALIMELCNDLRVFIDPHEDNFLIRYNQQKKEYDIAIIDTEHFPSIVGIKEEIQFKNHRQWYLFLVNKCFHDAFLRTKDQQKYAQIEPNTLQLS